MPLRILISHFSEQLLIFFFFSLASFNGSLAGKDNNNKAKNIFQNHDTENFTVLFNSRMDAILVIESAEREMILEK